MRKYFNLFFLLFAIFILTGSSFKRLDYREGMNKNVCKELKGNVLLYVIFVDTKETSPWTEFDIQSTLDSVTTAIYWIEKQAKESNINLNIISDFYIGKEFTTIKKNLPMGDIEQSATSPNLKQGLFELNKWADNIARKAGESLNIETKDGIPDIKNPRDKERLIAYLRDANQVESVALVYMVNNYFKTDISIPVNNLSTEDIEFAIVSYKYPSEIAHNLLHLFGAADLYETPFRRNDKKIKLAQSFLPNDIMQDPYGKSLNEFIISDFTKYLIGWKSTIDKEYQPLLYDNIINY